MKRILHLSDLHVGTEWPNSLVLLAEDIQKNHPDLILISGDLTQRARPSEYKKIHAFLKSIHHQPILCVPGNHDIALYNVIERFFYPFYRYNKWIKKHFLQYFVDDDLAILGINSVTPFKPMGGFVTEEQLTLVRNFFSCQAEHKIKIIVMHHNLISSERHKIINDAEKIITVFAQSHVNLVISGHIHYACIEQVKRGYITRPLYVVTAGTAISTRTSEPNSYNIIDFEDHAFKLSVREFDLKQFTTKKETQFKLDN